ncbi:hypothetical protein JDV02_010495 [Purpureocillium takamizusanense]|uniref:Uncharacterized protein n=1 Tax=Purpureocillium takamizusanense TaxID=2060973 RepID=A0A9Q8VGN5_9HYPO|nr:uncharacterized protein JDV02_010495 [Purpureocillium takamizusanense]UNI24771.1 hypothetical protein JDV02_010495 [Purpureocillium takamizusanense]
MCEEVKDYRECHRCHNLEFICDLPDRPCDKVIIEYGARARENAGKCGQVHPKSVISMPVLPCESCLEEIRRTAGYD